MSNIAVVGATGLVGRTMLEILEEREFPIDKIQLVASERSKGKKLKFRGEKIIVESLNLETFEGCDIALFSAGGNTSKNWAPRAWESGCVVIDNSSAWRGHPKVPLVVPEVNPDEIGNFARKGIIANPNCSTIQMVVALWPIHKLVYIDKIDVVTYQSVSGAGQGALNRLEEGSHEFDIIPQIGEFLENGSCEEEQKMINETIKIMGLSPTTPISATTVRVPIERGHSEVVKINTFRSCTAAGITNILKYSPGIKVIHPYPTAADAAGRDEVFVGRICKDKAFAQNGISMWVVADNIRKGAATNAVQIAEILCKKYLEPSK